MSFFTLNKNEIKILENNECFAKDWNKIFFKEISTEYLNNLRNVTFSGTVKLGSLDSLKGHTKSQKKYGIFNANIHNCEIDDNFYIAKVSQLSNYKIGKNASIQNTNEIVVGKYSSFGNGTLINVINESGKRQIPIYDKLSSHLAYILAIYRHRTKAINLIRKMVDDYTKKISSTYGKIGNNVKIKNSNQIIEVIIGDNTVIDGALKLKNGTINSKISSPVYIGTGVIAEDFIICSDTKIDNSTLIKHCFIGQGCLLDKSYSAVHSAFFANSQGFHGEACSIFAGPFTVTHHKSTLLIASIFSFMNAGSSSNQSNHMYKLGPIHQGVVERGAKTTSNSYLLWPAKIGAFNLVMGRHYNHPDTSDFPFSYVLESNDKISFLVPGINLRSIGTIRDAKKFPLRDVRNKKNRLDCINYNLLSPYTVQKMIKGYKTLQNLLNISGELTEFYTYNGMKITKKALKKGISLYEKAIHKFLGNSIISRINGCHFSSEEEMQTRLKPSLKFGKGKWVDLSGLICPFELLNNLLNDIEDNQITSLTEIESSFKQLHTDYYEYEWTWAAKIIEDFYRIKLTYITKEDIIKIVEVWKESVIELDKMLYEDAKKEFSLAFSIGFGMDGNQQEKALDFLNVRGEFESNDTVKEIKQHIIKKTKLKEKVSAQLSHINVKQL